MKFNKKFMSGALAGLLLATSVVFAAPATRNLAAHYGVTLNVNGSNFTVSDDSMRPFTTQDGRVYVSVAALGKMGIATVNYIPASKTVQLKGSGANDSALQAQINAQTAENSRLLTENNKLKQEIEALKKDTQGNSSTDNSDFSKLSSSERRTLARDIQSDIRNLRMGNTRGFSFGRFDGEVNIDSRSVEINLYPSSADYTTAEIATWNTEVVKGASRNYDDMLDALEEFGEDEVKDMVDSVLKGYSGYNITVSIYTGSAQSKLMAEIDYNYSRDRISSSILEVK